MENPGVQVPGFDTFSSQVMHELGLDTAPGRDDTLGVQLGLDSIAIFELYALVLDYGADIAQFDWQPQRTIGEVYDALVKASVDRQLGDR
jgi:hypothetical protein